MMVRYRVPTILAVVLSAASLFAHNGKTHIEGTVTEINAKQIVVKDAKGKSISIQVNKDTIYQRNASGPPATRADLTVGASVVIDSFGMPGGEQTALEIHFSVPREVDQQNEAGQPHVEQQ